MPAKAVIPVLVGMMLLTGCCNTLLTKYQDMQCVADCKTKHPKTFEQPVIQTLQMFIGETGCWLVVLGSYLFRLARGNSNTISAQDPVYEPLNPNGPEPTSAVDTDDEGGRVSEDALDPTNIIAKPLAAPDLGAGDNERIPLTGWKVLLLALPACCDITGTTLMNVGLLFVAASIYQMTRGALVLFVGLFSVIFLKRHLGGWKWASLFIVVLGVALVGLAGVFGNKERPVDPGHGDGHVKAELMGRGLEMLRRGAHDVAAMAKEHTALETFVGIMLIAGAQIFTATQFVLEESIMEKYELEPIKVVGWEGLFGMIVTLILMGILHGAVGMTEAGRGGYFDAREGFNQVFSHRAIAVSSVLIMISIGGFNFFGLSVTRQISATSRSTIDTCRTLFIWIVSLGLGWESLKWLQVAGFALLVYGTGLFNDIIRPPTLNLARRRIHGSSDRQSEPA
ncbi:hypothetical protein MBLNU457_6423t1 [Dothideomycetes sp. NU457]